MACQEDEVPSSDESQALPDRWDGFVVESLKTSLKGYGVRCSDEAVHELLEGIAYSTNLDTTNMYMMDACHINTYLGGLGPKGVKEMVAGILDKAAPNSPWVNRDVALPEGACEPPSPVSPAFPHFYNEVAKEASDAKVLVNPMLAWAQACSAAVKVPEGAAAAVQPSESTQSSAPPLEHMASAIARAFASSGVLTGAVTSAEAEDGLQPRLKKDRLPDAKARKWVGELYTGLRQLVPIELADERPSVEAVVLAASHLGYGGHGEMPRIPTYDSKPYHGTHSVLGAPTLLLSASPTRTYMLHVHLYTAAGVIQGPRGMCGRWGTPRFTGMPR